MLAARALRATTRPCSARLSRPASARAGHAYPFPAHPHPTPHQIFHLPPGASPADVKQRYIDLVKLYHPDASAARALPPDVAQARFLAIGAAYNTLRGRGDGASDGRGGGGGAAGTRSPEQAARGAVHTLNTELWKRRQWRRAELHPGLDERWKDRLIVGLVAVTVVGFVAQSAATRSRAIAETLEQARVQAHHRPAPPAQEHERRRLRLDEAALADTASHQPRP